MKYLKGLLLCLAIMPLASGCAKKEEVKYATMNLEQTLKEEELEYDLSSYKDDDNKITIYMFRGRGCAVCRKFLTFLNTIVPEYGKYFNLESYEVWYNKENSELMEETAAFLDKEAKGVPFIIIGDKVFPGYIESWDNDIKQTIVDFYNTKNRYDVFKEMHKAEVWTNVKKVSTVCVKVLVVVAAICVGFYLNRKIKLTNTKLESLESKLNEVLAKETKKEDKKVVKKVAKKEPKKVVKKVAEKETKKDTKNTTKSKTKKVTKK